MTTIKNIRMLKGAAVLAERNAATPSRYLKQYNLLYGFNGSGKSTLSRIFAALQHGKKQDRFPEECTTRRGEAVDRRRLRSDCRSLHLS